jgi:hypothetical protein
MQNVLRIAVVCFGVTTSTLAGAGSLGRLSHEGHIGPIGATDKHVQGIITAVDGTQVAISPMVGKAGKTAMGRVDSARTKLFVNGKPARVADVKITYAAKGELGLDDVWLTLNVDAR